MVQLAPSLSVNAVALALPSSCETNVRVVLFGPASLSVKRIGSSEVNEVVGALTSSHVAGAGDAVSSHLMRNVCNAATNIAAPAFQFTPMVGSPAALPSAGGRSEE